MRVVTRLTMADRRGARTLIELDGEPWEDINTEVVLRRGLRLEQPLDEETLEAILDDDTFIRARRAAAILLDVRPRSVFELRRRLREKEFSPSTIDRTEAYFTEKGSLDDARFARWYVRRQFKMKTIGRWKVARDLSGMGVEPSLVETALAEEPAANEEQQRILARRLIEKRLRRGALADDPERQKRRLRGTLERAGFSYEIFGPLLAEALDANRVDNEPTPI